MKNASLKTKYVVVFLGAAMVSYALIFFFIYARTMRYEMSNLQHFLDNSMEQAKTFVESETKMVTYASDTLYYNRDVYLVLDGCVNETDRDPGQEYLVGYIQVYAVSGNGQYLQCLHLRSRQLHL